MFILIAYDIADNRRLKQVAKLMEAYGERVQRSVFECIIDEPQLQILMHKVKYLMKRKEDKVQLYHLCEACEHRINSGSQVSFTTEEVYIC
ncbi:MAG: CRISPR-associated endonuclease Cas2 [Acidobacteriota bacterium]